MYLNDLRNQTKLTLLSDILKLGFYYNIYLYLSLNTNLFTN